MAEPVAGDSRSPRGVVYLDHAATSHPKPEPVLEAVVRALRELGSPGRGAHRVAIETARTVHETRGAVARLLGIPDSRDLIFQPECTYAVNLMLKGALAAGDRVVVSSMEHNAVARPLQVLARSGVEVTVVEADARGWVDPAAVEAAVRERRPRAVVCQHASNVTGTIQPIPDLVDIAHEAGALMLVDGAQAVGNLELDLDAIGADAYAASGHKALLGPEGVGLLHLSAGLELQELVQGGTGSSSESVEQPRERPARYEAGTSNTPGIAGLGAAIGWLAQEGAAVRGRTDRLTRTLLEGLSELPVRVLGPSAAEPRIPIVAFVPEGLEPDRLAFRLDDEWHIAVRAGLHCAPWAHRTLGTLESGAVRIGLGWNTTEDDVRYVLEALRGLLT